MALPGLCTACRTRGLARAHRHGREHGRRADHAAEGLSFFDVDAGDEGMARRQQPEMATTLYAVDQRGVSCRQKVQMVIDSIASGEGAVWLGGTIFPDGAVGVPGIGKFDPASGELTTTEIPGEAGSIAVGSGGVWAVAGLGEDGTTLYRIDPATGELTATIPLGEAESGYVKVSTGAGAVWVNTPVARATRSTLPTTRLPARRTRWGRSACSSRRPNGRALPGPRRTPVLAIERDRLAGEC